MSTAESAGDDYVTLTVDIVSAFVGNNPVPVSELPALVISVNTTLRQLANQSAAVVEEAPPTPAVPIRRSITQDFIVCLEDGKKFKSLKRHLRTRYNMTPDEYRARWNLPSDYPMVAPGYAATRSELARTMGLGQQRRKRPAAGMAVSDAQKAPAPRRARVAAEA